MENNVLGVDIRYKIQFVLWKNLLVQMEILDMGEMF